MDEMIVIARHTGKDFVMACWVCHAGSIMIWFKIDINKQHTTCCTWNDRRWSLGLEKTVLMKMEKTRDKFLQDSIGFSKWAA